jgi:hypothetical protein
MGNKTGEETKKDYLKQWTAKATEVTMVALKAEQK